MAPRFYDVRDTSNKNDKQNRRVACFQSFRCGALSSDSLRAGLPSLPRAGKPCLHPPWHSRYMCTAMPRLPFCMILIIICSRPEVSSFRFLSLSSSNLSTTAPPQASRVASLASHTWMAPAISAAFEARAAIPQALLSFVRDLPQGGRRIPY